MIGLVLIVGFIRPELARRVAKRHETLHLPTDDADAFLEREGPRVAVVLTSAPFGVSAALMQRLPALRAIVSVGVGFDRIDLRAAAERGIVVSTTPGALTECVADFALAMLLALVRRVPQADDFVRAGRWAEGRMAPTVRVSGKRAAVIGMGRIGLAIARRLAGFDIEIGYHDLQPRAELNHRFFADVVSACAWADFVFLAANGGPGTRHIISTPALRALGPQGYLVNVARGTLVDPLAVGEALRARTIAGAALDVFWEEPSVPAALLESPDTVLAPHVASSTIETQCDMDAQAFDNLSSWFAEGRLVTPLDLNAAR